MPGKETVMVRVLIADSDLDTLELVDDLIELNFSHVRIVRALTKEAFYRKLETAEKPFDLILFNLSLHQQAETGIIDELRSRHPELLDRMVFLSSGSDDDIKEPDNFPVLKRPFSLDQFGEVVKKACVY